MGTKIKIAFSVIVLGLGVYALTSLGDISWAELRETASHFTFQSLALALLFSVLQVFAQVCRIWVIASPNRVKWLEIAYAFTLGQFLNAFIPARAGDVAKIAILGKTENGKQSLSYGEGTGVILADKIIDILAFAFVLILSGTIFSVPVSRPHMPPAIYLALGAGVFVLLVFLLRWLFRKNMSRFTEPLRHFKKAVFALLDPKIFLGSMAMGMACWTFEALAIQQLCLGQDLAINMRGILFVLFVLNVAVSAPITVGNIGTFEASMILALKQFGSPTAKSLAIATLHHMIQIFSVTICTLSMWVIRTLWKKRTNLSASPPPTKPKQ